MVTADAHARRVPVVQNASCASEHAARAFPLPDDVLVCALEFLNLRHLWTAAGVSRQFYATAWRAGLYIHLRNSVILDRWNEDAVGREADRWDELVDHALRKDLRVAFTIVGDRVGRVSYTTTLPFLRKLLGPVAKSLPILVSLSIMFDGVAYPDLCSALRDPAPRLRTLCFRPGSYRDGPMGPITPSCGLFSGNAPVLHDLGLDYRALGRAPVPAFANIVRFATWGCDLGDRVFLGRLFPRLMHLMVSCGIEGDDDDVHQFPPPQIGLFGLTLRSLVLKDTTSKYAPAAARSLTTPSIAVFHCLVDEEKTILADEPLGWRDGDGDTISMHVSARRGTEQNIRVAPSDGSWRRSYIIMQPCDRTALYSRAAAAAQLAYLRLGHTALGDLVLCGAQFAVLRRLRVDIVIQPWDGLWYQPGTPSVELLDGMAPDAAVLQCPALESLALLWQGSAPEQLVTLDRTSVVTLGRALRTNAKPALELGDLDLERPFALSEETLDDGPAIHDVFSIVRRVGAVLDQFDGDEWNDNAALEVDRYLSQSLAW